MQIYENINRLLHDKKVSKRDFVQQLINLNPNLKRTGEVPSVKTIYKYLNGSLSIPIELVSYMAEALNVPEQEIFRENSEKDYRYLRLLIENASTNDLEKMRIFFDTSMKLKNLQSSQFECRSKQIEKLLSLLPYAPPILVDEVIDKLEEIKSLMQE
jgi:transcriptional regulator with XRE-family HTH domain